MSTFSTLFDRLLSELENILASGIPTSETSYMHIVFSYEGDIEHIIDDLPSHPQFECMASPTRSHDDFLSKWYKLEEVSVKWGNAGGEIRDCAEDWEKIREIVEGFREAEPIGYEHDLIIEGIHIIQMDSAEIVALAPSLYVRLMNDIKQKFEAHSSHPRRDIADDSRLNYRIIDKLKVFADNTFALDKMAAPNQSHQHFLLYWQKLEGLCEAWEEHPEDADIDSEIWVADQKELRIIFDAIGDARPVIENSPHHT